MKDRIAGVYYILNTQTNRIYIGQSEDIQERFKQHQRELRGARHTNTLLQSEWNTYGERSFEFDILVTVPGWDKRFYKQLGTIERTFIHAYQADNPLYGYNANQKEKGRKGQDLTQRLHHEANEAARTYRPKN